MVRSLTIATRGGALALAQTQIVIAALQERWPNLDCRLKVITTQGDRDQRTALWDLRDQGFFTSQLEQALLAGEADVAVHSFKDLPTRQVPGLQIGAVCDRHYPEDCLVAAGGAKTLTDLAKAARIGTSSLRRAAQVRQSRPDLQVVPIRGNVETRLSKLDAGQVEAVIMARAGLERLGLAGRISAVLDPQPVHPCRRTRGPGHSGQDRRPRHRGVGDCDRPSPDADARRDRTSGPDLHRLRLSCPGWGLCRDGRAM